MTKMHFERAARIAAMYYCDPAAQAQIINAFCKLFNEFNHRFDEQRFRDAVKHHSQTEE